jgi:malonate-semialdehyde dehydrogenase (acetylating)/methylmalonate-semialdehyde dehydrogenase
LYNNSLFTYDNFTGHEPDADLGPLISPEAKNRVCDLIQSGVDQGAQLLLDGRNVKVPGYENGNFVGPTILHKVDVSCNDDKFSNVEYIHVYITPS